jgi:prevent-host-death family protein
MSERVWQLQDAKNKFSEVVDRAERGEAQTVTKRGKRAVVVIAAGEYDRLRSAPDPSGETFTEFLRNAPKIKGGLPLPKRGKWKLRDPFSEE